MVLQPIKINNCHSDYIPYLDGVRALCIFLVLLSHFQYAHILPGDLGVTVFFVLSGFIITRVLFINCQGDVDKLDIYQFYLRRFFRLSPALLFFIIAMLLTDFFSNKSINWWEYLAASIYQHNYAVHIFNLDDERYFGHLWSLAVEEHFYLLFPLALLVFKLNSKAIKYFISLCFFIVLWRIGLIYLAQDSSIAILSSDHIYRRSDTRFDAILYGVILALLSFHYSQLFYHLQTKGKIFFALGFFFSIFPIVFDLGNNFKFGLGLSIQGIGITLILASLLFSTSLSVFRTLLSHPVLVWVGKISYSLYIWHVAVYWRFIDHLAIENDILKLFSGIISSILIAAFSFYFIESPIRNWGRKITQNRFKTKTMKLDNKLKKDPVR